MDTHPYQVMSQISGNRMEVGRADNLHTATFAVECLRFLAHNVRQVSGGRYLEEMMAFWVENTPTGEPDIT